MQLVGTHGERLWVGFLCIPQGFLIGIGSGWELTVGGMAEITAELRLTRGTMRAAVAVDDGY